MYERVRTIFVKANAVLDKMMPLITPLGIVLGFLLGGLIAPLKPLVTYLFAYVTLIGALGLDIGDFKRALQKPFILVAIFLCSHVLLPGITSIAARLCFPGQSDIVSGYVLLMTIPVAVSCYVWTSIFHGDEAVSLTMILLDTLLAPVVTPLSVRLFSGAVVSIDTVGMILSLFMMVVIPSIVGVALNQCSHNWMRASVVPFGKPFSKIALFAVIAINTSQVAGRVALAFSLIPIAALNLALAFLGYILGFVAAKLLHAEKSVQVSMLFTIGMRNISAALVLAINFFPPESALPVVIGIVLQQTIAALSGQIFFGREKNQV
jgi:tagaturonate reductase